MTLAVEIEFPIKFYSDKQKGTRVTLFDKKK